MLKKILLTLSLVVSLCAATFSIKLPFMTDLQPIGRIRQAILASDLAGAKFTARFNNSPEEIACFWGGVMVDACGAYFTVRLQENLRNLDTFEVRNTSTELLTDFTLDALTFSGFRNGKHQMFGNLAIDLPSEPDTVGSGAGHALAGALVKEFKLFNRLSYDLYGGVAMKIAIAPGQTFRFRCDIDELVAQ